MNQSQEDPIRPWIGMAKDSNDFVITRIEAIGTKALGVFTVSALAIGIAIPLGASNMAGSLEAWTVPLTVLLSLASASFLIMTVAFVIAFDPASYKVGPSQTSISEFYVDRDVIEANENLLYWIGQWWMENMDTYYAKAKWLRITIFSAATEILLIGVWATLLFVLG